MNAARILGFEVVNEPDPAPIPTKPPMSQIDAASWAANQEIRRAAMKAGSPLITRRTFAAKDHPKGSPERERLNQSPVTSDRKGDYPWVLQRRGAEPEYFGRYELAEARLIELVSPHRTPPLPFGGANPPPPQDPDKVVAEGEWKGKTEGEAYTDHFRPGESAEAFFERRKRELQADGGGQ